MLLGAGITLFGLDATGAMPMKFTWEYVENFLERGVEAGKYWLDIGGPDNEMSLRGVESPEELDRLLTMERAQDLAYIWEGLVNEVQGS